MHVLGFLFYLATFSIAMTVIARTLSGSWSKIGAALAGTHILAETEIKSPNRVNFVNFRDRLEPTSLALPSTPALALAA